MQRVTWTDERLDDLSRRMDTGFERVDGDIRDLRSEMNAGFAELRTVMYRFGGTIIAAIVVSTLLHGL
jgi:hypothetical protein